MDLKVKPGPLAGTITVELFPSHPASSSFRLSLRSGQSEQVLTTGTLVTEVSNLVSGQTYLVSALGLSVDGLATEISPEELVLAP